MIAETKCYRHRHRQRPPCHNYGHLIIMSGQHWTYLEREQLGQCIRPDTRYRHSVDLTWHVVYEYVDEPFMSEMKTFRLIWQFHVDHSFLIGLVSIISSDGHFSKTNYTSFIRRINKERVSQLPVLFSRFGSDILAKIMKRKGHQWSTFQSYMYDIWIIILHWLHYLM